MSEKIYPIYQLINFVNLWKLVEKQGFQAVEKNA